MWSYFSHWALVICYSSILHGACARWGLYGIGNTESPCFSVGNVWCGWGKCGRGTGRPSSQGAQAINAALIPLPCICLSSVWPCHAPVLGFVPFSWARKPLQHASPWRPYDPPQCLERSPQRRYRCLCCLRCLCFPQHQCRVCPSALDRGRNVCYAGQPFTLP